METPTTSPAGRLYSHDSWLLNSTDHHFSWATSKKRGKKRRSHESATTRTVLFLDSPFRLRSEKSRSPLLPSWWSDLHCCKLQLWDGYGWGRGRWCRGWKQRSGAKAFPATSTRANGLRELVSDHESPALFIEENENDGKFIYVPLASSLFDRLYFPFSSIVNPFYRFMIQTRLNALVSILY